MNRLTPFAKILIFLLIGVALYFGINHFFGDKIKNLDINTDQTEVSTSNGTSSNSGNSSQNSAPSTASTDHSSSTNSNASFSFKPQQPIGGKLMGVVELGASGFNSFIIRKDRDDNWAKEKYEWGNSMVVDGMATAGDVRTGLRDYIAKILDYGVSGKDIHFVVSSGAAKEKAMIPIINELKKMGYFVNQVTPEQEGEYALMSVLPKEYANKAFVVDIGSGNTKVSWKSGSRVVAKEADGAKYYRKNISDSEAYNKAKKVGRSVPSNLSKTCFIIGGVPFNMAKKSKKGDERYTVLGDPGSYSELAKSKGQKVQSGLNIYQGLKDGTGCDTFIFDWNANFTIGFLLGLPG